MHVLSLHVGLIQLSLSLSLYIYSNRELLQNTNWNFSQIKGHYIALPQYAYAYHESRPHSGGAQLAFSSSISPASLPDT